MSASSASVSTLAVDSSAALSSTSAVDRINSQALARQAAQQAAIRDMAERALPAIPEDLPTSAWLAETSTPPGLPFPKAPPAAILVVAERTLASSAQLAVSSAPLAESARYDLRPDSSLCWICKGPHFARECFHSAEYARCSASPLHSPSPSPPTFTPPPTPAEAPDNAGWWEPEVDPTITCSCSMPALSQLIAWITRRQ